MALLRRSLSLLGVAERLQKMTSVLLPKMPNGCFLHTLESPSTRLHRSIIPTMLLERQNNNNEMNLSIHKNLNNVQILPSLPRGTNCILDLPARPLISDLQMPTSKAHLNNAHIMPEKAKMEDPFPMTRIEKHAIRLIVIRRHKMKKHQRKKAYKKNRIIYARIRQARKAVKERNLHLRLLAQLNEGRSFSPEKYAFDILSAAYEKIELHPMHRKKNPWEF